MKFGDTFYFAWLNLKLRKMRTLFTLLGVVIGISAFVFFTGLSEGVKKTVFDEILKSYSLNQIIVKNQYATVGIFKTNKNKELQITDQVIENFRKIRGVEAVYPVLSIKIPATIKISLFDSVFASDVPLFGLDPAVFKDKPELFERFSKKTDYIPGILHAKIIDFYNSGIAESHNLPMLDDSASIDRKFTLKMGYSLIMNNTDYKIREYEGRGAGLSDRVPAMGLSIPLAWAKKIKAEFEESNDDFSENTYNLVYLDAKNPDQVHGISNKIEEMGFNTTSAEKITREIDSTLQNLVLILSAISFVILIVAGFSMTNTISMSVITRTTEIGIMRACGATKWAIYKWFLIESFIIGAVGGLLGLGLGIGSAQLANIYLLAVTPDLSFKPSSFFFFPWWVYLSALGISLGLSLLAGFLPSRRASNLSPLQALTMH